MILRALVIDPPRKMKTMFIDAVGTGDNIRFVAVDTFTPA
jgi:hypothetical protein